MASYPDIARDLAVDLAFLTFDDFINLRVDGDYVQVIQESDSLSAELMVTRPLEQSERGALLSGGWQPPQPGRRTWRRTAPWPLTAATARELAEAITHAAQTYVAADSTDLECDARNYGTWEPIEPSSLAGLRRAA